MDTIKRSIELPKDHSFFLFGPRQTGKSTLLKMLFLKENILFYNLLDKETFLRFLSHPSLLREEVHSRRKEITHVIIDEVQRIPDLLNEVHLIMESPNPPFFVLTGSSARRLKRHEANLLAGRALSYSLHPLTIDELGSDFSLLKALQFGTIPSIYTEGKEAFAIERLRAYVDTYLQEEIEREAQLRRIDRFSHFLLIAGSENGNVINYSNIARETSVSLSTVKGYFQILVDTLIGRFIYPFTKSVRHRLSKHPKFYFFDVGVARALSKQLTVPLEPHTSLFGRAFEHFIVLEIMRYNDYNRLDLAFSHYRTEKGVEVDLIIETPRGKILAIEIKATDTIDSTHLRSLRSFAEASPGAKLCCVCQAPHRMERNAITILPWQELLTWLTEALAPDHLPR
ncbi:hypothetical protein A2230_02620 [candidate division WOR-1 bacterium RIFOXYA2_FULL_36_21]|uniref:AAA+ ATPase domain-containing protein n=1 Tax=candidate division WOR-1 bacterium RIFOXYB2_FULL_36_35 TaxID=1802578 RepID=A0A1F4RZC3_UNCSA|nr:MAG: hypothetical protein A2230_02620 [candidate division WOR-1 bacterium RIFOXYA2_FULL_36_21]OGC13534.1 MAG: hypothetical protein A2290_02320 [candidate division WOR-1 bacterium RIFOXYB2_FULL_36_35]OGC20978.1 MAG: hypothetical protein A2282_00660 [candidate division WOR-1 bacterium RIFOXYA12_FULL_36_13]